jgi:hypothetical protein
VLKAQQEGSMNDLKSKIEKILSEILSDKYEAIIKIRFEQKRGSK